VRRRHQRAVAVEGNAYLQLVDRRTYDRIAASRAEKTFTTIEDVWRRAGVPMGTSITSRRPTDFTAEAMRPSIRGPIAEKGAGQSSRFQPIAQLDHRRRVPLAAGRARYLASV
jgi:hypothetical protein